MRRSSRKMLIAGALTLAALAGPVGAAHAAGSLTLTPATNTFAGQANKITVAGNSVGGGFVAVYAESAVTAAEMPTDCEATADDEVNLRDYVLVGTGNDPVPDGAFSLDLSWSPFLTTTHVICAYLYSAGQTPVDPPQVMASKSVAVVAKPANSDSDGDGVPNDVDRCPDVAGSGPDGCAPTGTPGTSTPTPTTTVVTPTLPGGVGPVANVPATNFDPTGVLKLKPSKGKTAACGAGCLVRTRTVGAFSFEIKVTVSGKKAKGAGSVTLTRKSAQAGTSGRVCLGRYTAKTGPICKTVKWTVGKKVTVSGSIATPSAISRSGRPGLGITAYVGQVFVGSGASIYLKSAGGKVKPDTNESACAASAGAHAAC